MFNTAGVKQLNRQNDQTTRIELGRPRAGGQNGPGMGLEQFSNDVLVGDLVRPREKRSPSQTKRRRATVIIIIIYYYTMRPFA